MRLNERFRSNDVVNQNSKLVHPSSSVKIGNFEVFIFEIVIKNGFGLMHTLNKEPTAQ